MSAAASRGSPARRTSRSRLVIALLAVLALSFLAAEACLRAFVAPTSLLDPTDARWWRAAFRSHPELAPDIEHDPLLGWRMRRGYRAEGVTHDADGHRVTRGAQAVTAGEPPVVVLGDSFTYGLGVRDEETWPARLASESGGRRIENLAVNGHGLDQQLLFFETEGVPHRPSLVILGYFLDDFRRNGLSFREGAKRRFSVVGGELRLDPTPVPTPDAVRAELDRSGELGSYLLAALDALKRRVLRTRGTFANESEFATLAELNERLLERLNEGVGKVGGKLVVITIPHCTYAGYRDAARIDAAIQAACGRHAIPCIPTSEECARAEAEGVVVFGENCHFAPAGHARIARYVVERLKALPGYL